MKPTDRKGGRKSDITKLSDAMSDMMKDYHIEDKYFESRLISSWDKVMGPAIANRTGTIYIRDRVLVVHITSAPLRQELQLSKHRVMQLLEEEAGRKVIEDIMFR